jgi:uncharacterized MnhB-related membrane protein
MSVINWLIDGTLALSLFLLAWQALTIAKLSQAITLFIAFGLLMALTWMRLAAWEVAIMEILIGVGVTGFLLLKTWRDLEEKE